MMRVSIRDKDLDFLRKDAVYGRYVKISIGNKGEGNSLIKAYEKSNEILTGINGPYDDEELKVRNLCHLIIITSIEF